jgi:hypothetical protein
MVHRFFYSSSEGEYDDEWSRNYDSQEYDGWPPSEPSPDSEGEVTYEGEKGGVPDENSAGMHISSVQ